MIVRDGGAVSETVAWTKGENVRRKAVITLLIVLVALGALAVVGYSSLFPTLPRAVVATKTVWLDQGWTADQREKYYQTPQGSLIIPYSWFFALEQPGIGNRKLFAEEENLLRYDVVPDPGSKFNPDHLPVGIGKQIVPKDYFQELGCGAPPCPAGSSLHREWLTYTCAACHTSRLMYKGTAVMIEGGRGRWDFTPFNTTIANLLLLTSLSPPAFDRFAARVIAREGRIDGPAERARVRKGLHDFLWGRAVVGGIVGGIKGTYPTDEGFGRMDALGRGANGQFEPLDERNSLLANAPVLIPPLWYTHDFDWVQTVAAIRQPLGRNVTESWGVNSAVNLTDPDPAKRYATTIGLHNMFWMETLISIMTPPSWPEQVFGKVDPQMVELGRQLYEEKVFDNALTPAEEQWCAGGEGTPGKDGWQPCPNPGTQAKGLCARCHAPIAETYANSYGKKYWQLPMYKLDVVGTDPWDAANFNARIVNTGLLQSAFGGKDKAGIGEALLTTTSAILARELKTQGIAETDIPTVTGFRDNNFRAPLGYPARPLVGYWATPPYLHNGSVPSMYELLSPVSERSATFWTGDLEFDPVHLAYRSEKFEGGFKFETRRSFFGALLAWARGIPGGHFGFSRDIPGNSNLGHEFRNAPKGTKGVIGPYLTPKERLAIIEYLKVMPALKPIDGSEEQRRRALLKDMEPQYEGSSGAQRTAAVNH